jgi:hypothetical protein
MKKPDKPVDPFLVYQQAISFYKAIDQLHRSSTPEQMGRIAVPVLVLSAFASELFLKCLIYYESRPTAPIREHLLLNLFLRLSPPLRKRLSEIWDEIQAERAAVLDQFDASMGRKVPRDLESNLRKGSDGFRLIRYVYEGGVDFEFTLSDLPRVLCRAIIELEPEWGKLKF